MTLEELEQAFQNLSADNNEQVEEVVAQEAVQQPDSYLTYDNVDRDFGNWYKHDKDIGAILMEQLQANGVDTRDATEAALRQVLTDIVSRLEILTDTFSAFKAEVDNLKNTTQQVTSAVEDTLHAAGATVEPPAPDMGGMMPPPPDMGGAGELPPIPEMSAPATGMPDAAEAPAPDMGGMPPAEAPMPEMPPEPAPAPAGTPSGTPSDARIKTIRVKPIQKQVQQKPVIVSDEKMKKVEGTAINPAFASICNWR